MPDDSKKDADKVVKKMEEKARGRQQFKHNGQLIYEWEQTLDEVHIYIVPPPGITNPKHDFEIKIEAQHLLVKLRGSADRFLDHDLGGLCCTDESFWMMEDGELHVLLGKAKKAQVWPCVLRGHDALDAYTSEEQNKKIMLERFQEEHPGFDFSQAEFSGSAPEARNFMGGVGYR